MKLSKDVKVLKAPRQSPSDKKDYKFIKLANGLSVLLVKNNGNSEGDAKVKKQNLAAVAMCIESGCFNDPPEVEGMSHLIEHISFMGSEKYPKENELDHFITTYGGFDNAFTECEYTLYYFDIIEKQLAGALDRFAQIFTSPLIRIECMEREIEIIESEFQNNSMDDDVRLDQIFASMICEDHPASNFIWGNMKTFSEHVDKDQLQKCAQNFVKSNYTADRMFLCVQSNLEMNRLERTIVKCFSELGEGSVKEVQDIPKDPLKIFKADFYEKIYFVKSTTEKCKLLMTFLMPPKQNNLKFLEYLGFLIQFEGIGSLSDYFMDELLALKVKSKVGRQSFEGNSMFTFFQIEINLTTKGFQNMGAVLKTVFAFLLLLKSTPMTEHEKLYNEFKDIKNTLFKFRKEKAPLENVQDLAVNMKYFQTENVIIGKEECPNFDESELKSSIEQLNERYFNLLILSDKYHHYEKTEKWFGTEYSLMSFPPQFQKLWNERWFMKELSLPKKNYFVCRNFDIYSEPEKQSENPTLIFKSETCVCYHKLDKKFQLPHGFIYINFNSSLTQQSVTNMNMTSIFSMCVKNFLSQKLFPATVVGYNYKLNSIDTGLMLRLSGFSEKLPLLLEIILETIKYIYDLIDKLVFETFKKELKKNCHNCLIDSDFFNDDCRHSILKKNHKSFYDRYRNIDSITYNEFKIFCIRLLNSFMVDILIQGNLTKETSHGIVALVLNLMNFHKSGIYEPNERIKIHKIPTGASYLRLKSMHPSTKNSIVKNYYQVGEATIEAECIAEFIASAMYEPLFDALRTREQLGYAVNCSLRKNGNVLGISVTVEYQENKKPATYVDAMIEKFLEDFLKILYLMTDDEFQTTKRSIVTLKLTEDTDLQCDVDRNWNEIRSGELLFDRNEIEAQTMDAINKTQVLEFYKNTFFSHETRKLSVQVIASTEMSTRSTFDFHILYDNKQPNVIDNIERFTQNLEVF